MGTTGRPAAGLRLAVLVVGVAALGVAGALLPLRGVPDAVGGLGPAGPIAGVLVGALLLIALVPRTPISVACGLLFGPALGTACAILTAMMAATATFALGRLLGRAFVLERLSRREKLRRAWANIERWIAQEGVLAVAAVRSWPLGPYGLVGYVYGTSGVRVRDYAIGSLIAGTPSAAVYATLGAAAGGGPSPVTFVLLPFGLVLTAVVAWRSRPGDRVRFGLRRPR
ncbi:MAG TPA: VTT domain-containing protein [Micromonosporaceae bacterium]